MCAVQLRDREMELKTQISAISSGSKETAEAEKASGEEAGPLVTDADIATIVSQWTRIPVEKVCAPCTPAASPLDARADCMWLHRAPGLRSDMPC